MATTFFDTHHYVKCLEISDTPINQAEAHAKALAEAMNNQLVRKTDLNIFKAEVKADISEFKTEIRADISEFKAEIRTDINEFKAEVRTDLGGIKAEFSEFKADISEFKAQVKGQFDLLKWMAGFSLASTVGILAKLFH